MFKKLMAKFGVGAATVDLRLDKEAFRLGEEMTGTIHIEGGSVEQRIANLEVEIVMKAYLKGQEVTRVVQSIPVLRSFTVMPKPYSQQIPFRYHVPHDLAVSTPSIRYLLRTKLDVVQAMDPTDLDYVTILPPVHIEKVLLALEQLDFRQKPDSGKLTPYGQEFSFFPARPLSYPLRELEVIFLDTAEGLRILAELDMAHGFMRHEVEHRAEILVPRELLADGKESDLVHFLGEKIESYAANPHTIPYFSMAPYDPRHHGHFGHPHYGHYGHDGHHGYHGIGGMIGGMAAGLVGGMLLSELMDGAADLLSDQASDLIDTDITDFLDGDGNGFDDGGFGDGGGFDGGDFGDFDL